MVFDGYRRRSVYFGGDYQNLTASWEFDIALGPAKFFRLTQTSP